MAGTSEDTTSRGFDDPVDALPGIGRERKALLANLGLHTLGCLALHLPRAYQDRRTLTPIGELAPGMEATVTGEVTAARNRRMRGRNSLAEVRVSDGTGEAAALFFGRGFLAYSLKPGTRVILTGKVESGDPPAMRSPEYEVLEDEQDEGLNTGRITPVYRLTGKLGQRHMRRWIREALHRTLPGLEETLPGALRARRGYPPLQEALLAAHFPETAEAAEAARERFAYEELLAVQLAAMGSSPAEGQGPVGVMHRVDGPLLRALRESLPFTLTPGQERAVEDILGDMAAPRSMLRLIQGDVGCGKTAVALHAIAAAADSGRQAALMAPTEVLAEQHALTLSRALAPLGIRVELLTGALRGAARLRKEIAAGAVGVTVGTQALIQEQTEFHDLGLVIVDEQHRFGVAQRGRLSAKGQMPDVLHMTATPIPRTLAITLYGGMDLTLITCMPPGRRPVKTRRIPESKLAELYRYLVRETGAGQQAYIVCPLVEESEAKALTPVIAHFEALSTGPLAGAPCALLHGRLDAREKEDVLRRFQDGAIRILFTTTVIEVGIDVPNANIIVIENAPQFGLTQLHQLRGRVGRGTAQAYCFLLGEPTTEDGKQRLEILCNTQSGFEIAEADLRLRGPGEFQGLRQAGLSDLRAADLLRDAALLEVARRDARAILAADPGLEAPEHAGLARAARRFSGLRA